MDINSELNSCTVNIQAIEHDWIENLLTVCIDEYHNQKVTYESWNTYIINERVWAIDGCWSLWK